VWWAGLQQAEAPAAQQRKAVPERSPQRIVISQQSAWEPGPGVSPMLRVDQTLLMLAGGRPPRNPPPAAAPPEPPPASGPPNRGQWQLVRVKNPNREPGR